MEKIRTCKKCSICKEDKDIDEFGLYSSSKNKKRYHRRQCIPCFKKLRKEKNVVYHKNMKAPTDPKVCCNCDMLKPPEEFNRWGGGCKECRNKRVKKWRLDNQEKYIKSSREYYWDNKERINAYSKQWNMDNYDRAKKNQAVNRAIPENRERAKRLSKKWHRENLERVREYLRDRYENDTNFRLRHLLSGRIIKALKRSNVKKNYKTMDVIGCSIAELRQHLEGQFKEGMSWDSHGEWHIDHIRPCASFDLTDEKQQRQCFHYNNLQPLWAKDNLSKGDKWEGEE